MGLAEQLSLGARLIRETTQFRVDPSNSGSINLGSAYVLLGIQTDVPCRFRLYDTQVSRDTASEISRPFTTQFVSAPIALVGDFSMSAAGAYTVDPVLYGVINNAASNLSYYRAEGSFGTNYPTITLRTYKIEDSSISIINRKTIEYITGSLSAGSLVSGRLSNNFIPKTYLLVSASLTNPLAIARLRLYSTTGSLSVGSEVSRSFATESNARDLIVDMILTGSQVTYFSPKIIGANLQTSGFDLGRLRHSDELLLGEKSLYYILQNVGPSGSLNLSASLHLFSLED